MTSIIKIRPVLTFPAKHCVRLASSSTVHEDVVRRKMLEKIIRVDHAGEMGASYIYKGNHEVVFYMVLDYGLLSSSQ